MSDDTIQKAMSHEVDTGRLRRSRFIVAVLVALGATLFYFQDSFIPTEHRLTVILTGVEHQHEGKLLRYEDIQSFQIKTINAQGELVAETIHRSPGAVAKPAPIRIPTGAYSMHFAIQFQSSSGATITKNVLIPVELEGGDHRLEL